MKTSQKLVLVVAGLSLGACSSNGEKNTFMSYNDLQDKVISHEEQWQMLQTKLDRIDELEAEVTALKQGQMGQTASTSMMADKDVQSSSMGATETVMLVDETVASNTTMMADEEVSTITPAPIFSENEASENKVSESDLSQTEMSATNTVVSSPMMQKTEPASPSMNTQEYKYGVQVASYSNRDEAIRGWAVLNKKDPASYQGLEPLINQREVNGRTMYQLKVGPFVDKSFSSNFCQMLKGKGKDCLLTRYNGDVL